MASEVSTIQSLKAVDAWIDVINANINGGVRTAFKSSRLKFSGSNTDVQRTGNATSLPLQFPEPGLTTANTVIDFTQGAVTASTENTHLAIQGEGFFAVASPGTLNASGGWAGNPASMIHLTRDGEFHVNENGLLVTSYGYFLMTWDLNPATGDPVSAAGFHAVYNDLDLPPSAALSQACRLSDFLANTLTTTTRAADGVTNLAGGAAAITKVTKGKQSLQYSQFGATVFYTGGIQGVRWHAPEVMLTNATTNDATVLNKSLEASNASMTQSVPELSLAQKLFSALTKVLQTKQTNVDGVLNLVR